MSQQTNGADKPSNSGLVNEKTVPCVLDNAAWSGLDTTYDLNDPHSGELLVRVSHPTYTAMLSLCLSHP